MHLLFGFVVLFMLGLSVLPSNAFGDGELFGFNGSLLKIINENENGAITTVIKSPKEVGNYTYIGYEDDSLGHRERRQVYNAGRRFVTPHGVLPFLLGETLRLPPDDEEEEEE